ncbi:MULTISPECIES: MFS transporter [unclassified Nocardioides]|uniref:MFS transporter n=1 Tax=unclassified Nocardioides TaxID=2615069 RepID=UPI0006FC65D6|nr:MULTISPECIES: MFS transporter [unclassified Nocardioides]KQY56802.1 MFS transporter [Nocardioides sp. Root140]KQZ67002.1 MFS transporter [Nocardioides sp. Root151]
MTSTSASAEARRSRTLHWVVGLSFAALLFDGYDLVVYGTVVPTLLADKSQIGALTPEQAGTLGSWALIGVLVGALTAGAIGDLVGRRRIMLVNIAWFSVGMALTATTTSIFTFGAGRFLTGIGVGALVATVGALVAEFAPADRRNRYNAIVYSGIPAGGVCAALAAIVLDDVAGWRGLFWIGALPVLLLLPLAWAKLPESPLWLLSRGETERAAAVSRRTGVALPAAGTVPATQATKADKVGYAALASRPYLVPTILLGLMSFSGLLLTYGLNTWLPQIMEGKGYGKDYALAFLLLLNLGAIVGGLIASWVADHKGARRVVATTFLLAAVALLLMPFDLPFTVLLAAVAVAGVGSIGTQVLIYGLVSNYYPTSARAAGVAWCAGFGRLGGIVGPVIGGILVGAGVGGSTAFQLFAAVSVVGAVVTLCVRGVAGGRTSTAVTPDEEAAVARDAVPA